MAWERGSSLQEGGGEYPEFCICYCAPVAARGFN